MIFTQNFSYNFMHTVFVHDLRTQKTERVLTEDNIDFYRIYSIQVGPNLLYGFEHKTDPANWIEYSGILDSGIRATRKATP